MNKRQRKKQEKRQYLRVKREAVFYAKSKQFAKRMAELIGIPSPLYLRLAGFQEDTHAD